MQEVVVASPDEFDSLNLSNYTQNSDDGRSKRKREKLISKSKDQGNYPNLEKYLTWARFAAMTQLVLMLLLACFLFLVDFLFVMKRDSSLQDSLVSLASGFFAFAIIAVVAYSTYVFLMAIIEFIHVIVDIEANTRRMASRGAEALNADSL